MGMGWMAFLIVGLLAGWIAEKIMKRDDGLLMNLLIGIVGAYVGGFLGSLVGIGASGFLSALVLAVLGAVVLLWVVAKVRKAA